MLAKSTAGFEAIRDEVNRRRLQYNTTLQERYVDAFSLSTPQQTQIGSLDYRMSYADIIRRYLLIALVFPARPGYQSDGAYLVEDAGTYRRDGVAESLRGPFAFLGDAGADREPAVDLYRGSGRFAGVVAAGSRIAQLPVEQFWVYE